MFSLQMEQFCSKESSFRGLFIRKMNDEERLERRHLRGREQGAAEVPVKRKWRRLEHRINRLRIQYQNGERKLEE